MQQLGARRRSLGTRLAFRFALLLLALTVAAALSLKAIGELNWSGPRVLYFIYLGTLIAAALILVRLPKLSWTLLVLTSIELCWGVGSFALERGASLLPPDFAEIQRFKWHPLLEAVPIPSLAFTSSHGLSISHTSAGTRGREPKSSDIEGHAVVALFGGSSTYDIGVGEGDTWADRIADALGRDRYFVINHGVPGYTTVEHVMQTSFYQDNFGRSPRCAVYYVGWNDLRNMHLPTLDPGYADFHLISQVDSLRLRRVGGSNVTFSPLLTVLARIVGNIVDTVHYPDGINPYDRPLGSGPDPTLLADFERNVRTISAINRARRVPTLWVGQLINCAAFIGGGTLRVVADDA